MTVFLLPDGRPFLGGTYFPRRRFVELLRQVSAAWHQRRAELEDAGTRLAEAVRHRHRPAEHGLGVGRRRRRGPVCRAADRHRRPPSSAGFDAEWGGFGSAPKFPQPSMLETLLLAATRTGRADITAAVTTSLDAMAAGGIYDHLGGGFARYSTDQRWLVPHFEKMLYDNALLARTYLHAWQHTGSARYRQVVTETLGYLLRAPMRIPGAGLASAEDADSEGVEGRFYVWDQAEVLEVGGPAAVEWYGVTPAGNWEGHNILVRPLGAPIERPPDVEVARQALFDRREERVRPGLDDKVLTEWNAMAIAALAEAGAALGEPAWLAAARRSATSCSRPSAGPTAGGCGAGRPARRSTSPTPGTTPGWSRRSSA